MSLSSLTLDFPLVNGALASGIVTTDELAGAPPSADLSYVLPEARSAVSFAVPIDPAAIDAYMEKRDRRPLEEAFIKANMIAGGISLELANFLSQKGFPSVGIAANNNFRPGKVGEYYPDISHRYLALRSGTGFFGLSGNILTKEAGAAVILGSTVTSAQLEPTGPAREEDQYCDDCGLCMALCTADFFNRREQSTITMGEREFTYSKRMDYGRCDLVCSGYTGLHKSGKWSTWSPGRYPLPEGDEELEALNTRLQALHDHRPDEEGGRLFHYRDRKLYVSCALCQLVCDPDPRVRKKRYRMMSRSGVIILLPDGSRRAVSPEEARRYLDSLSPEERRLYEPG